MSSENPSGGSPLLSEAASIVTASKSSGHHLRILVAPSGFKESVTADQAADCIETGLRRVATPATATIRKLPLNDGGEGFCRAMIVAKGGQIRDVTVTGPIGDKIDSHYGVFSESGTKVGVVEMAAAAGLSLVPSESRDPTRTSTYGVGELLAAALDEGCDKIIMGCGDSGTSDGGAGMLQALGVSLLDADGKSLPTAGGGGSLDNIANVQIDQMHPRLRGSTQGSLSTRTQIRLQHDLTSPM